MTFLHAIVLSTLFVILGHIDQAFGYCTPSAAASWKSTLFVKDGENEDIINMDSINESKKTSEPMTLVEYAEKEREAARKLNNRLLLPDRIGKAITATFYAFVILGFLLNILGFAYIRNSDGSLTIGTIETRRFQEEINRTVKQAPTGRHGTQD